MAIALTGCLSGGSDSARNEARPASEAPSVTLTLRHSWTEQRDRPMRALVEETVRRFEAEHPHVHVELQAEAPGVQEQRLQQEMAIGRPPDLFTLTGGAELAPYVRAGRLLDLSEDLKRTGLDAQYHDLGLWTVEHRIYGLPLAGAVEPVYYNQAIFNRYHLTVPQNPAQLDQLIRTLRANDMIPFALGNRDGRQGAMLLHYLIQRHGGGSGSDIPAPDEPAPYPPEAYQAATERLSQLAALGAFPEQADSLSREEGEQLFLSGQAAMLLESTRDIPRVEEALGERAGVFNLPLHSTAKAAGGLAGGYVSGIAASAQLTGDRRAAAVQLLTAFAAPAFQERVAYEAGLLPATRLAVETGRLRPLQRQVDGLLVARSTFLPYSSVLLPAQQEAFHNTAKQLIPKGGSSP